MVRWLHIVAIIFALLFGVERLQRYHNRSARLADFRARGSMVDLLRASASTGQSLYEFTPPARAKGQQHVAIELLDPTTSLPHLDLIPRDAARRLYDYSLDCQKKVSSSPEIDGHPSLVKMLVWQNWLCDVAPEPDQAFFAKPPFMHPAGRSYAAWYLRVRQASEPEFAVPSMMLSVMHAGELAQLNLSAKSLEALSSPQRFARQLDAKGLIALARETELLVGREEVAILLTSESAKEDRLIYRVIGRQSFDQLLDSLGIEATLGGVKPASCLNHEFGICWRLSSEKTQVLVLQASVSIAVGVLLLLLLLGRTLRAVVLTRREGQMSRDRMLQLLTHELRTPVASLKLQLETFRDAFDGLTQAQQDATLRSLSDVERMRRVITLSEQYVRATEAGRRALNGVEVSSAREFFTELASGVRSSLAPGRSLKFNFAPEDFTLRIDPFWTSVVTENLVRNAFLHGQGRVALSAKRVGTETEVVVEDEGLLTEEKLSALRAGKEAAGQHRGLGIGLKIINQLLAQCGGRLEIDNQPTRFKVIFPDIP